MSRTVGEMAKQKEYYGARLPFMPVVGCLYVNEGGGTFLCVAPDASENCTAVMQNTKSGWTFTAYGIGRYPDGRIDWDYSKGGRFIEERGGVEE